MMAWVRFGVLAQPCGHRLPAQAASDRESVREGCVVRGPFVAGGNVNVVLPIE